MKFVKDDGGFLLLESLVTLSMIATILLLLYPLLVQWMQIRNDAKVEVELNRVLYESTMDWEENSVQKDEHTGEYHIKTEENLIQVTHKKLSVEVVIYDYEFQE